jgi:hypothetical protein
MSLNAGLGLAQYTSGDKFGFAVQHHGQDIAEVHVIL